MAAIQFTEATKAYPRTIAPAGKYPIVGDRIYRTLQDAQDYVDGKSSSKSAIPGIYLSVIDDGINNGAYWVEQAAGYDGATVGVLRKMGAGGGGGGDISLAWDDITGKPSFADVATSGSYNDLTDKPTIPSLDGYATQQWVSNQGFAVATSLGALAYKGSLSWSEIVDRPTKLSNFTNDAGFITSAALAGYLKEEDAETIYITEEEAEDRYVKRGGDSINGDISFGGSIKIGGATLSWDEASHALKVDTSFYSTKQLASGGIGDASGSGLGLILNEWPTDSEDYSKYALGGNLGIELNTRLTAVEGKATNVTVSPTLSQGKPMGTIMVDGVSQTMYAPASYSADDIVPTQERNFVSLQDIEYWNTAYLPKTGGTLKGSLIPDKGETYNLGSSSYKMGVVYAKDVVASHKVTSMYATLDFITTMGIGTDERDLSLATAESVSLYDTNSETHFAMFSGASSIIYSGLEVNGGITVNGASVATQTWADGRYLKLSGQGKITSPEINVLYLNSTSSYNTSAMVLQVNGTNKAYFGVNDTNGAFIYNYAANSYIGVKPDGTPHYNGGNILIHSGNYSSYALPLSGGAMSGAIQWASATLTASDSVSGAGLRMYAFTELEAAPDNSIHHSVLSAVSSYCGLQLAVYGGENESHPFFRRVTTTGTTAWEKLAFLSDVGDCVKKSGDAMTGNLVMRNNAIVFNLSQSDTWANPQNSGLRILNTVGASATEAISSYAVGLSVSGYYGFQLASYAAGNGTFYYRNTVTGANSGAWKTIAFTDSNVASATKLATARTIWGQSFDGTGNVSGDLYLEKGYIRGKDNKSILGADSVYNIDLGYGCSEGGGSTFIHGNQVALYRGTSHTLGLLLNSSGNVGIGTSSPAYTLDVSGVAKASGLIGNNVCIACGSDGTTSGYGGEINRFGGGNLYIQGREGGLILGFNGNTTTVRGVLVVNRDVTIGNSTSGTLKIGGATLSWDSTNNALKIEGNVYATGQMASGGIGTAVATIASDHEDRIAQLEAKVQSLMS